VTLEERFWAKVDKSGPIPDFAPHLGQCWLWTASSDGKGYGQFQVGTLASQKVVRSHRFAYENATGEIIDGLVIDHLCRVTMCCNPSHLELVSHQENLRRGLGGLLRTHCAKGHEFSASNTAIRNGKRKCRQCHRDWAKDLRTRKREHQHG